MIANLFRHFALPAVVFITGACVLIVEVVAVRALSPYFGNTIFTFSSVISVILAALSIGYYVGGKLSDRRPSWGWFFGIILVSGTVLLGFYFLGVLLLPLFSVLLPVTTGPLVSSLLLFMIPALLLGTLSPYAVKLQSIQLPQEGVGSVAGTIFFWSTLGSISGSLLAGFVLVPQFGIDRIFFGTGLTLCALGLLPLLALGYRQQRLVLTFAVGALLGGIGLTAASYVHGSVLYHKDGVYETIMIYDTTYKERPTRFFLQDQSFSSAMFLDTEDPTDLALEYSKYYELYQVFKPDVTHALVIGGAAYSLPKALLAKLPEASVHVSEIEPSLFELAKRYFNLTDNPRLTTFTEDGRRVLARSTVQYDLIFGDAYHSLYSVPSHLTTQEFFSLVKEKLTDGGVFVGNFIGDLAQEDQSFILSEIKTFKSVFPNSYFFAVDSATQTAPQNIIFIGYKSDRTVDFSAAPFTDHANPLFRTLNEKAIHLKNFDLSRYPILTDNFSPAEYMAAQVLRRSGR